MTVLQEDGWLSGIKHDVYGPIQALGLSQADL